MPALKASVKTYPPHIFIAAIVIPSEMSTKLNGNLFVKVSIIKPVNKNILVKRYPSILNYKVENPTV